MTRTPLTSSLRVQARVVHALILREVLTRFGRHNLGFLWLFIEPMLFTVGVAWLWSVLKLSHSAIPVFAFAVTGYSSVLLWRSTPGRLITAVEPNRALMHHRNVRLIDIYAARVTLELVGVTASLCALTVLFWWLGLMDLPRDILLVAAAWLLLCWFGAAFALCLAGIVAYSELIEKLWHPLSYLLFPVSGAAFMVDWLAPAARSFVLLLPMVHCTEMLREGYFGPVVRFYYDPMYVVSVCLVLSLLGLAMVPGTVRRLQAE